MQDIIAPFVLENLACSGTEARLLDCPVSRVDRSPNVEDANEQYLDYDDALCSAESVSYAFVACGPATPGQSAGVCPERSSSNTPHTAPAHPGPHQVGALQPQCKAAPSLVGRLLAPSLLSMHASTCIEASAPSKGNLSKCMSMLVDVAAGRLLGSGGCRFFASLYPPCKLGLLLRVPVLRLGARLVSLGSALC